MFNSYKDLQNRYPSKETTDVPHPMDTQIGGDHYRVLPIQPMEYSMMNGLDACQHTIIKYVTRFRDKGGLDDLLKARHVIDMLIAFEQDTKLNPDGLR